MSDAMGDGVDASSYGPTSVAGRFTHFVDGATGLYARGGGGATTADIIVGSSQGQNTGRISTDAQAGADLALRAYDQVYVELVATGETGNFIIRNESSEVFEIRDNGNVRQEDTAFGIPKLAMRIDCSNLTAEILNYASSLRTASPPTISNGASAGRCTLNTNISLTGRYVVATAISSEQRNASVIASGTNLNVYRFDAEGIGVNGNVYIVIY